MKRSATSYPTPTKRKGSMPSRIHLGDEWMHNIDGPWKDNQAHGHVPKDSYKGDSLHESWEKGFYHSPSFPIIVRQYWNKGKSTCREGLKVAVADGPDDSPTLPTAPISSPSSSPAGRPPKQVQK